MITTWQDVLKEASQRIRRGWCQGQMEDDKGNVCALGAIRNTCIAYHAEEHRQNALLALQHQIKREQVLFHSIAHWNDILGQTAENVAATMEKAAQQ